VFVILLGSYAFFWHGRDWNTASRLMLTYALGDRGTIRLDGLEVHTNDIALFRRHYYTDKLPGYSLLAVPPYLLAKSALGLRAHPVGLRKALPGGHWPADYWVTLATSGLASALTAALLVRLAGALGCGPRRAALVGLAYGLATPAFVYATLAVGHQVTAAALLGSFILLWRGGEGRVFALKSASAGALAALAAVVELQVGPVSAVLGLYLLAMVVSGRRPAGSLVAFAAGAAVPSAALLAYNAAAFGSPWDMGYFHERLDVFSEVHSASNPLGLSRPNWSVALPLLWGDHRGLLFYAPIVALAVPGWIVLAAKRRWDVAAVTFAACLAVYLVNLSYRHWDGGWSTGPRLLVPLLPFAMVSVAALLAVGGRGATVVAVILAVAGGVLMLLFQGVGARIPQDFAHPLVEVVWPLWRGDPVPLWREGARFDTTIVAWRWPGLARSAWQFLPLVLGQGLAIALMWRACRPTAGFPGEGRGS
jgi:hypothetical protein